MPFVEFNWTANAWQFRFGDTFNDFRGARSWTSLADAKSDIESAGLKLERVNQSLYRVSSSII
jgi:hypothetical protein